MAAFREEVLDEKPYIDAERAVLATPDTRESTASCHGASSHVTKDIENTVFILKINP